MGHAFSARRAIRYSSPWLLPFGIAFLLIAMNIGLAIYFIRYFGNANARADHALQTMLVLKQIENLAEISGQEERRYRASGDRVRLDAARQARAELPVALDRLRDLTAGEDDKLQPVASLRRLIEQDIAASAAELSPIELHFDDGRFPQTLAAGVARTDAIIAAVDGMLERERSSAQGELAAAKADSADMLRGGTILRSIGILAVATVYVVARRRSKKTEDLAAARLAALQESQQRFARIFDESPVGIVLAEADGQRIMQANPAFCRLIGISAAEIIGSSFLDLTHVNDREVLRAAVHRGTATDGGIEVRYIARSGAVTWASVRLAQLSEWQGRARPLLALVEDITREKRVEAELRQAQKMEAIGQLTGGIAHDFNNLLGVIIGNVEFLMDAMRSSPDHVGMAKEILDSALSGADLTRRLLAFARRQTLQPHRIDLNAYLPNHIAIIRRLLGETIQVTANLSQDLWPIRVDPSQVGDALLNLAINARDAMPHGGHITVHTANARLDGDAHAVEMATGDYVVLSVTDTGTGMPPEVLERVVEPFFTTKGPGVGSGLGLSMVFGFVKQSGGHLRIDSEVGQGTTARLYFPRAHGAVTEATESASPTPLATGNETVLLVDDNAEMRAVARRHLTSLGYCVSEAGSGPAALAILHGGERFDLLFTDVVMPEGMTGYQLAAAARQMQPGLKVLFTTGYARSESGAEISDAPVGPMIRKPYRKQELAARVRAALSA